MKKGCLIAAALALVLGGGIVFFVLGATKPLVEASDGFLGKIGGGRMSEAYASSAQAFKDSTTEAQFEAFVSQMGLDGYQSSSWNSRGFSNDQGEVEGTITTKSGATIPLKVSLIKEGGEWKVMGLHSKGAGVSSDGPPKAPLPGDAELKKLATATVVRFDEAVKAKGFTAFHATCSTPLKAQFTPEQLQGAFQEFIDKGIDLGGVKGVEPVLDVVPAVDGDGVLALSGYFPTDPAKVRFKLSYVYEHPDWKPLGVNVKID